MSGRDAPGRSIVRRSRWQTPRHNDFVDDLDEHDREDNEEPQRRDRESDDEYGQNDGKDDRRCDDDHKPAHAVSMLVRGRASRGEPQLLARR